MASTIETVKATEMKAKQAAEEALAEVQSALASKNLDDYNKSMNTLKERVDEWNKCIRKVKYAELAATESPMIEAVKAFYVDTKKIREDKDDKDGTVSAVVFDDKRARIDLEKFCVEAGLSTEWAKDSEKLLDLLTLRETNVFSIKPSELAKKSFYFIGNVAKKKDGETPDSNTQIVRLLQQIIDGAIFVDDGSGKNVYKCTNHDIAFIQDSATKMDTKEKCTIAMLNARQFKTVMMGVFAHCLGEKYTVKAGKSKKD